MKTSISVSLQPSEALSPKGAQPDGPRDSEAALACIRGRHHRVDRAPQVAAHLWHERQRAQELDLSTPTEEPHTLRPALVGELVEAIEVAPERPAGLQSMSQAPSQDLQQEQRARPQLQRLQAQCERLRRSLVAHAHPTGETVEEVTESLGEQLPRQRLVDVPWNAVPLVSAARGELVRTGRPDELQGVQHLHDLHVGEVVEVNAPHRRIQGTEFRTGRVSPELSLRRKGCVCASLGEDNRPVKSLQHSGRSAEAHGQDCGPDADACPRASDQLTRDLAFEREPAGPRSRQGTQVEGRHQVLAGEGKRLRGPQDQSRELRWESHARQVSGQADHERVRLPHVHDETADLQPVTGGLSPFRHEEGAIQDPPAAVSRDLVVLDHSHDAACQEQLCHTGPLLLVKDVYLRGGQACRPVSLRQQASARVLQEPLQVTAHEVLHGNRRPGACGWQPRLQLCRCQGQRRGDDVTTVGHASVTEARVPGLCWAPW